MEQDPLATFFGYAEAMGKSVAQSTRGYAWLTRLKTRFLPDWTETEVNLLLASIVLALCIAGFKAAEKYSQWKKYGSSG